GADQVGQRRQPIAGRRDLVANLPRWKMSRPRNDGWNPYATLEQAELRSPKRTSAPASKERPLLGRMTVGRLEHDDRVLAQTQFVKPGEDAPDPLVHRRNKRGVLAARR